LRETYYAGAYWGARQEPPEECGRRAEILLTQLSTLDPSLAQWFKRGNSRRQALEHRVGLDGYTLAKMFRRGKDRVFAELGFRISLWNGASTDEDACGAYVTCGCHSERVCNVCLFHLPSQGPNAERVLTAPLLAKFVRAMAVAWEPEWAIATSSAHRELVSEEGVAGTFAGWVIYHARRRGPVPPLPTPVRVEPVEDKGSLIVLTPERFTASNPEHLSLAERVRALLDDAGLLAPIDLRSAP
jgi:hypothetical protein